MARPAIAVGAALVIVGVLALFGRYDFNNNGFGQAKTLNPLDGWIDVSTQLPHRYVGNNQEGNHQGDGLRGADDYGDDANFKSVVVRRLLLLICSILIGFGLALWGGMRLDYERPLFSASVVLGAISIPCGGWLLFGASLFRTSWNWWP